MEMDKKIEELYNFRNNVVSWIGDMILEDGLRLRDIPSEIRKSSDLIYAYAFRASRNGTCPRFISDLNVLCEDIITLYDSDKKRKNELTAILSDTLQLNDYKGDKRFENYKEDMDENLLRELHNYERSHGKQLQALLGEYCDKNGIERVSEDR